MKICPVDQALCDCVQCPHISHMSASQPDPTPQDVAAPTLEQLAKAQSKAYNAYIKANAAYCAAVNAKINATPPCK